MQATVNASAAGGNGYISPTSFQGDGVYVPAGSCSWSSSVSWTQKNINVIGSNPTITHASSDAFDVTVTTAGLTGAAFRISGFSFSGSAGGHLLQISATGLGGGTTPTSSTAWAGLFRVDHLAYNYTTSANVFQFNGSIFGLFDHLNGTNYGNHFEQSNYLDAEYNDTHGPSPTNNQLEGEYGGRFLSAAPGSSAPGGLGSQYMDFIEDSTFSCPGNYSGGVSDSESGGQRMVFRHNTLSGTCFWYAHWTRGTEWDGDLYEIYNNTNTGNSNGQNPARFGSGTGVIFNNSFPGTWTDPTFHIDETRGCGGETGNGPFYDCNGTRAIDGNAGDPNAPGWPCAGQIGSAFLNGNGTRGGQGNLPLIAWNNGTQTGCSTGGSCSNSFTFLVDGPQGSGNSCPRLMTNYISSTPHSVSGSLNGAVDYCQGSTKPSTCGTYTNNYVPYTYPHPLQVGGSTNSLSPILLIAGVTQQGGSGPQ